MPPRLEPYSLARGQAMAGRQWRMKFGLTGWARASFLLPYNIPPHFLCANSADHADQNTQNVKNAWPARAHAQKTCYYSQSPKTKRGGRNACDYAQPQRVRLARLRTYLPRFQAGWARTKPAFGLALPSQEQNVSREKKSQKRGETLGREWDDPRFLSSVLMTS